MTRPLITLGLLAALACSRAPKADAGWSRIDAATFTTELAAPRTADAPKQVIIDVREPDLFAAGHIPGAVNMPWPDARTTAPSALDKSNDVVLVCHGGPMGDELAAILVEQGFGRVRNLAGGMNGWTGPVVAGS